MNAKLITVLGTLFLIMAFSMPARAQETPESLTIGTGGTTGVYYPVGNSIARLINRETANHGLRCSALATGASVFNVNAIASGDLSMGIVQSDTQYYAYTGSGPEQFVKAGPNKDLRVLFSLYAEAFTLVAKIDANINSFDELAGKRVNIGEPGSGNRSTMELLMNEYGWTEGTFAQATDFQAADMAGKLCNNHIDAFVYVVGNPNASIKEATTTCESHVVNVSGPVVDKFIEKYPFYAVATIPGGMYRNNPVDVKTFGPMATLMCSASLPEETAYHIVKTVFENFDQFRKLHPVLGHVKREDMLLGNSAPFHPGAIRYFKEVGLMK